MKHFQGEKRSEAANKERKILLNITQEDHATFKKTINLNTQRIKIYFEANISYDQEIPKFAFI